MFSRDVKDYRMAPRTLQTSKFGAYAKLHVEPKRSRVNDVLWMLACGVAIGIGWYVLVAIRAGA